MYFCWEVGDEWRGVILQSQFMFGLQRIYTPNFSFKYIFDIIFFCFLNTLQNLCIELDTKYHFRQSKWGVKKCRVIIWNQQNNNFRVLLAISPSTMATIASVLPNLPFSFPTQWLNVIFSNTYFKFPIWITLFQFVFMSNGSSLTQNRACKHFTDYAEIMHLYALFDHKSLIFTRFTF